MPPPEAPLRTCCGPTQWHTRLSQATRYPRGGSPDSGCVRHGFQLLQRAGSGCTPATSTCELPEDTRLNVVLLCMAYRKLKPFPELGGAEGRAARAPTALGCSQGPSPRPAPVSHLHLTSLSAKEPRAGQAVSSSCRGPHLTPLAASRGASRCLPPRRPYPRRRHQTPFLFPQRERRLV